MSLDRQSLKRRAQEVIATSNPRILLVGLVYLSLTLLLQWLAARVMSVNISESEAMNYMNYVMEGNVDSALSYLDSMQPPASSYWIHALLTAVLSIVSAGFLIFLLKSVRRDQPCFGNLLDGFGCWLKILVLNILISLLVFLGCLLLLVPGLIAHYRYSQALYLLVDDPTKSPIQCLRESRLLMQGHKMELFELDLSFLGWYLLTLLPLVGYAARFWTVPYVATTKTLYFEALLRSGTLPSDEPAAL